MLISKYAGYFHDGDILNINHSGDNMEIAMKSAEVDPEDINSLLILSKTDRITGKLHLEGIKKIIINKKKYRNIIKKTHEVADILDFSVSRKKIKFFIEWRDRPPQRSTTEYSAIEIGAEKIWWENIPDLEIS